MHGEISDWSEVPSQLARAAAADTDFLIINGGDGTIREVVSGLLHDSPFDTPPILGIVPGGQTNMLAGDLGAKASPVKVLSALIEAWEERDASTEFTRRKVLRISRTPDEAPVYGFFFGSAAIVSGIEFCHDHIYPLSIPMPAAHVAVVGLLLTSVLSGGAIGPKDLRPTTADINVDDVTLRPKDYFCIIATTMNRLMLNLHPFSSIGEGPVKFAALEKGPTSAIKAFPKLLGLGSPSGEPDNYFFSRHADRIEINSGSPYTIDGEFYHPEPNVPVTLEADAELTFLKL